MATPTHSHDHVDDWEILQNPDFVVEQHSVGDGGGSVVNSDYFSLDPAPSPPESVADSENPSWVEPPDSASDAASVTAAAAEPEPEAAAEEEKEGGGGTGERAWWKTALEIVRVYVLRVRPAWSVAAAAILGAVVLLGRRIYRMKHKSRSVPLRIAIDDKKVSQFMAGAARLNEVFSVVKRAPAVRPSLPAGGITSWPMLALR
ncbi:uncharacterized protein M6B38_393205 [Iris pallida]|uniref:DUF6821 domain-containing protein n=1 Tax=Iris pallida TaxID=29817 RepID=A0AAX6FYL8_IRIPA|nr:uncharacterized protein M6B38_393205 [Iris pallida]